MTHSRTACPGSQAELSWLIPNATPTLHYDVFIRDPDGNVLRHDSDYQSTFGSMLVTAPSTPGQYSYSITVVRDNYGQLSDVGYLLLNVTQMALSDIYILNNPLLPGTPFTVYWTINAANPQSDELVQVIVNAPSNTLGIPETFRAFYPNGETGSATFWAPSDVGTYPLTITSIGRFGCSDVQTILLQTRDTVVDAGSDRTLLAGNTTMLGAGTPETNTVYTWSPADWLNTTCELNPLASPLITTTYTVVAFRSDINHYASDQVTIQVIDRPQSTPVLSYFPGIVLTSLFVYFGVLGVLIFVVLEILG